MPSCSICVEDLHKPTCCIPCGHVFCSGCINDWKQQKKAHEEWCCPQCRKCIIDTQLLFIDPEDDNLKYKEKCGFLQEKIDEVAEQLAVLQSTNEQLNTEISLKYKPERERLQDKIDDMKDLISKYHSLEVRLKYEKDDNSKLSLEVSNLAHEVFTLKEKEKWFDLHDGKQHRKLSIGYYIYVNREPVYLFLIMVFVLHFCVPYGQQQRLVNFTWNTLYNVIKVIAFLFILALVFGICTMLLFLVFETEIRTKKKIGRRRKRRRKDSYRERVLVN